MAGILLIDEDSDTREQLAEILSEAGYLVATACNGLEAAKSIVFMFNNVEPLERLRRAVGPDRCEFGFPTGFALLIDDKLRSSFTAPGQAVYVSNANWARVFREAKIPSIVEPDMESFWRTHAAFAIPLMASGVVVYDRGAGITWSEAQRYARALREGIALVRRFGSKVTPRSVAFMAQLPGPLLTALLWGLNRTQIQREFGSMGPGEVSQLIDAMERLAPGNAPTMLAIRPSAEPLERPRSSAARSGEVALR